MTHRVKVRKLARGRWFWWCVGCYAASGAHPGNRLGWELAVYNGDQHARHGGRG